MTLNEQQALQLLQELIDVDLSLCDECGGDDSKCVRSCAYRRGRELLARASAAPQEPPTQRPTAAQVRAYSEEHCVSMRDAKTALTCAAPQPQAAPQEPVAWHGRQAGWGWETVWNDCADAAPNPTWTTWYPLYAAPQPQAPSSDDVRDEMRDAAQSQAAAMAGLLEEARTYLGRRPPTWVEHNEFVDRIDAALAAWKGKQNET